MAALIAHAAAGSTVNPYTSVSTSGTPRDTTGANFIVGVCAYSGGTPGTIADNFGNVLSLSPASESAPSDAACKMFWVFNPIVGPGHYFNVASSSFPSIAWAAFSGVSAFGAQNGAATSSVPSLQPGSVTPANGGELIVTGCCQIFSVPSINGGFSITDYVACVPSVAWGTALAYKIKAGNDVTAENPLWTFGSTWQSAARIAAFTAKGPIGVVQTLLSDAYGISVTVVVEE